MKANELRIGNLIEYVVYDYLTPQEEWVENYVDIDDLNWLNKNPDDDCYRPIKLTEDILVMLGFEHNRVGIFGNNYTFDGVSIQLDKFGVFMFVTYARCRMQYTHQLQNLYFALTGEELELQLKTKENYEQD
jgi:hypothetical protein